MELIKRSIVYITVRNVHSNPAALAVHLYNEASPVYSQMILLLPKRGNSSELLGCVISESPRFPHLMNFDGPSLLKPCAVTT